MAAPVENEAFNPNPSVEQVIQALNEDNANLRLQLLTVQLSNQKLMQHIAELESEKEDANPEEA